MAWRSGNRRAKHEGLQPQFALAGADMQMVDPILRKPYKIPTLLGGGDLP